MMFGFDTVIVRERASTGALRQFHELGFLQFLSFILYQQGTMTKLYIIWDYVSNMLKVLFSLIEGLHTIFLKRQNLTIQKHSLN